MGVLSDLAKARYKGEASEAGAPRFGLTVGDREVAPRLVRSVSGSYVRESGSSSMSVEADFPFARFEEEKVRLRVGYGDHLAEYFTGALFEPSRNPLTGLATCEVYGPFKAMQSSFGRDVDFTGDSVAEFFLDLGRRTKQPARFLDVREGYDVTVEEGAFVRETELGEAARTVAEKLDFVLLDRPGWRRLVMPTPAPGARARSIARYDEGDYLPGAFNLTPNTAVKYARVNVFRRDDQGGYPVDEWAEVASRGRRGPALENRVFYVPEFPGTPKQARNTALRKARMLSSGTYSWELADVFLNPELLLYDSLTITRTNLVDYARPALEVFSCLVDKEISFEISFPAGRFHMTPSGETAVLRSVTPLQPVPDFVPPLWERGIVPPEPVLPAPGGALFASDMRTAGELANYTAGELS